MLRALPAILREFPNFVYIVLGATHPEPGARAGRALPAQPGATGRATWASSSNVIFYNRFVELERAEGVHRRRRHLRHALPEPGADHLRHAGLRVRLRQGGRSRRRTGTPRSCWPTAAACWCRSATPAALAREICGLLRDEPRRHAMRKKAYLHGPRDDLEPRRPPVHGIVPAGPP